VMDEHLLESQHLNTVNSGIRTLVGSQTPFCYGYDQNGNKGFAVDSRRDVPPCEGVNESG
jgi:hypothetical protein